MLKAQNEDAAAIRQAAPQRLQCGSTLKFTFLAVSDYYCESFTDRQNTSHDKSADEAKYRSMSCTQQVSATP